MGVVGASNSGRGRDGHRVAGFTGIAHTSTGMKVLGTPLGHPDFVQAHLDKLTAQHQILLDRIPHVEDTQAAWLLLVHCGTVVLNPPDSCGAGGRPRCIHAVGLGGSRFEVSTSSHPVVANQLVDELEGQPTTPFLSAAAEAARNLTGTLGSTHRVGRRRCTERAHPFGTQRISSQGPSGKVGSTKQVLLSRLSSARRCSLDCRTRNKL